MKKTLHILYAALLLLTGTATPAFAQTIHGNVYGGGEKAKVEGETLIEIKGGTVTEDVYGGGALADVIKNDEQNLKGNTTVNLTGGTIRNSYGGGLGSAEVAAFVMGDATTTLNGSIVLGSIFGCNNLNGTPEGHAFVHIKQTKAKGTETEEHPYHVASVYGGGNLAAYIPADNDKIAEVLIENCDNSIEYVYGGGNAASTPATKVTIEGGEIYYVFGGGNGKTEPGAATPNPGADVGYRDFTYDDKHQYGRGITEVKIYGGTINSVFGGSNTKGNIRVSSNVNLDDKDNSCSFEIGEVYGAGNEAEMHGDANVVIGCISGLKEIYGGAKNADFHGDVSLTITNGHFEKVFGGNNQGGKLLGSITVNIDETGCNPVVIDELYGGGNLAAYSVYGYEDALDANGKVLVKTSGENPKDDPRINIISCTHIGTVYGGGLGESAVMVGNPTVNINEIMGKHANVHYNEATGELNDLDDDQELGSIGTVFGGGNAAEVIGSTSVNVGTEALVRHVTGDDTKTEYVPGANITGNIYGGGNQADVTGQTHVTIGR